MLRTLTLSLIVLASTPACSPVYLAAAFRGANQGFNTQYAPQPAYSASSGASGYPAAATYASIPPSHALTCLSHSDCLVTQVCFRDGPGLGRCINAR